MKTTFFFSSGAYSKVKSDELINTSGVPESYFSDLEPLLHPQNPSAVVCMDDGVSIPGVWIADAGSNNLKRFSVFLYTISPPLPTGLHFDFSTGSIVGTPLSSAPVQTYTITTYNSSGTNTITISFSIDPPGPVSNAVGTHTSTAIQADGLTINYFEPNNCAPMLEIADSLGGSVVGAVDVKQTIYPTIATFNADTFIGRVLEIDAQNPQASANISLYFTYLDIVHFNQSVPVASQLSNDTTGGTMQVGVLQLHSDSSSGVKHIEPIIHNPVTAIWFPSKARWQVNFAVTKFSSFYVGDTAGVSAFNCASVTSDSVSIVGNYYIWNLDTLFSSGVYVDTLNNITGCDSIATLKLTLNQTTGLTTPLLEKAISVYPNPSMGLVNVNIQDPNVKISNIKIMNLMGTEVYRSNEDSRIFKIDLGAMPAGIYIISITSAHETVTKRIIIE